MQRSLYTRSAQQLTEEYLAAMNRLNDCAEVISTAEALALQLSQSTKIPAIATWKLGSGCLLSMSIPLDLLPCKTESIENTLNAAGFKLVSSGQPGEWLLVDTKIKASASAITLHIEEY